MSIHELTRVPEELAYEEPGWVLSPEFLVRICGLPTSALHAIRSPRAMSWIDAERRLTASLELQGVLLRDRLEHLIAEATEANLPSRPHLINLRRDIFNERKPRAAVVAKLEDTLSSQDQDLLACWQRTHEARSELRQSGVSIVDEEIASSLTTRQQVLGDEHLRSAVLLQSADLERNMDRYLRSDQKLDKHSRQIERSLLELLQRAAGKTSPFSTLTSVAYGQLSQQSMHQSPVVDMTKRVSHVQANVAILSRLSQVILSRPELRWSLDVALAPGASTQQDLVRYVRRRSAANINDEGHLVLDNVHEDLYLLPNGPAMQDVLRLAPQATSLGHLAELIVEADKDRTIEEVGTLLGHLLRVSLLIVPSLKIDLHSSNPFDAFSLTLAQSPLEELRAVASRLAELQECVARYQGAPSSQRAAILREARAITEQAFAALEADLNLVPKVILYEDVVHGEDPIKLSADTIGSRWEQSLTPFAEILPAFDARAASRLALHGFFMARFGRGGVCDDFQRFSHEFQRDFFGPFSRRTMTQSQFDDDNRVTAQENWFKSDVIKGIDAARALASELLLDARNTQPGRVVQLSHDYVKQVAGALVRPEQLRQPWSFLCQQVPNDADGANLVINQSYSGHSLMFSRFLNALEANDIEATQRLSHLLRATCPEGAVLAELGGNYESTNLNLHPSVTDYEIVCPGDVSTRPESEQIHLEDLVIEHDAIEDRVLLRHRHTGVEVIPVYLGFLMPLSLPEVHQILLCFSPMGMAQIDLWAGTGEKIVIDGVTHYPRVQLNDLVLHREMWKMPSESFPLRQPAEPASAYFLRVHQWREEHGIPMQFFARIDFMDMGDIEDSEDGPGPDGGGSPARKPLGVDLTSWHSLMLLEQLVRQANKRIVLTEALPHPDDAWITDQDGQNYVSELLLELYPNRK